MNNFSRSVQLATALQAYASRSKTDSTREVDKLLQLNKLRAGSFDKIFPAMFSLHGIDIKEAINRAIVDKDITKREGEIAVEGISKAMDTIAGLYPVMTSQIFSSIDQAVSKLLEEFNVGGTDYLDSTKLQKMKVHLDAIKNIFSTPYIVTYFSGDSQRVGSLKIAHNSFANLRDIVNRRIKSAVQDLLKENKITRSKLLDDTYLTTKVINWGHTRTSTGILTGKLLADLLSARRAFGEIKNNQEAESALQFISDDFIEQTGQEKTIIKITHGNLTKGDPSILSLVIESGIFQTVVVQNRRENQEDLSQAERKWNILDAIGRKNLLPVFGASSIQDLARKLLKIKSSPSVIDNIGTLVANTIAGIKTPDTSKVIPLLKSSRPITKKRKKIKVVNNTNKKALRKDSTRLRTISGQFYSLASLQQLLDAVLVLKVKENMGDGSRRDILNLRSGRFAESVKVERMSQSREGMITAFYTYMKNPYATFSVGGRQEYPKTRDPKLLISQSIREIAATKVANRLRAVSL